jgi:dimeric dUTPase (all-alpha-NTP-PPase superfamily)
MPKDLTIPARKKRVIVLEEMNFVWDEPELEEMAQMWESGSSVFQIAKHFKREDPDEVILAVMHLARKEKIAARESGLNGERGIKVEFNRLFQMQKELDQHIEDKHPRQEGEIRHNEKVLALLVELGELANETRCFKFWSSKPASEKQVVLEEFVDGVHFLLSIGLENGIKEFAINPVKKASITEQFLGLYNAFSVLSISFSPKGYSAAFSAYVGLGEMLGFGWDEVEAAYGAKNTINHARQEEWY